MIIYAVLVTDDKSRYVPSKYLMPGAEFRVNGTSPDCKRVTLLYPTNKEHPGLHGSPIELIIDGDVEIGDRLFLDYNTELHITRAITQSLASKEEWNNTIKN